MVFGSGVAARVGGNQIRQIDAGRRGAHTRIAADTGPMRTAAALIAQFDILAHIVQVQIDIRLTVPQAEGVTGRLQRHLTQIIDGTAGNAPHLVGHQRLQRIVYLMQHGQLSDFRDGKGASLRPVVEEELVLPVHPSLQNRLVGVETNVFACRLLLQKEPQSLHLDVVGQIALDGERHRLDGHNQFAPSHRYSLSSRKM